MTEAGEIARFHDRCSHLMRALLDELAAAPERPRPFPEIEDALGCYRFQEPRHAASRRWELWMDAGQARAVRSAR